MLIPPKPIVLGIRRWLELIPEVGVAHARALLATAREYADLTPTQYAEALDWIVRMDLNEASVRSYSATEVLERLILTCRPTWFEDADVLVQEVLELPADLESAADAMGIDGRTTLATLRRAWGKVDVEARARIGTAGELEVLRHLQVQSDVQVTHVAEFSDSYGFDIAIERDGECCNLEVKSTTRENRRLFYLSRHEFETMLRDPDWRLVYVVLDSGLQLKEFFTIPRDWIIEKAPTDRGLASRWEVAKIDPPREVLGRGLPDLATFLSTLETPLLSGRVLS